MGQERRNTEGTQNRRRGGRVPLESVMCDLGEVVDLSPTGICVVTRKKPKGTFLLKIYHFSGTIVVECEVVRTARCGLLKREVGLRFVDPLPHVAATLAEIARAHGVRGERAA